VNEGKKKKRQWKAAVSTDSTLVNRTRCWGRERSRTCCVAGEAVDVSRTWRGQQRRLFGQRLSENGDRS
jgi:hypothetical protein